MTDPVTWPYSTHDEVSHLAIDDAPVLRARIDQLLEERRQAKAGASLLEQSKVDELGLTTQEARLIEALYGTPMGLVATKERLHAALSDEIEPETDIKLVDVIVCKVRRKLAGHGMEIVTHWGRGYSLAPQTRAMLGDVSAR
jgi:DNA-binding response OmpR family regulator